MSPRVPDSRPGPGGRRCSRSRYEIGFTRYVVVGRVGGALIPVDSTATGPKIDMAVQARPCLPYSQPYTSAGQCGTPSSSFPLRTNDEASFSVGFGRYDSHFWGPIPSLTIRQIPQSFECPLTTTRSGPASLFPLMPATL